ncbi:toll-like receptor 3 [Leptopilina boulardi]|uniref:toll-like receptor 3 n=1 Tax=Leptopilina boulardi TaxID=63433 RepID=UPI0021F54217|nr:toll-like receptor 3 [Leptopilina boulardi]
MGFLLQLFGLVIITLCFDFGESFQTNPLGNDQQLTEELQSLVGDAVFGYDELSLTWCQKQHPDNVSLDLSELGIRNLPKNFISSQHVTCLDLQNNEFENRIEFNIFKKQPNLEYLNLAETYVNLQYLLYDASHPKIKTLVLDRANNYGDNENEKVLHLRFPNLENLSLQQLNYHNSYNPYLSYIDFSSTKLTHLYLSNNNIPKLNDQFFEKFPSTLTHLFLERCNLNSYSSSINQTASLISLSMDGNKFSCSNGGCLDFENHPELKYLSLANCEIISLSHNTFLSNLKLIHLDLSGNQIQQLSERTFLKTPALESLNLNDNQLWKIPNLHSLINLKKLYVKNNQITNLDQDSFSSLENLQILSLSTNNINSIDSNTFDNLLSLIVLDLSGNQISNLEYRSTFNLQYLILTNNTISSMDNIQLGNNTTLEYLVLVNNPLMSITPKMLQFLPDDTTIVLKEKSTVSKMGFLLQLFGLVIITLCFDFGESFQTNPLGNDQQLTEELQSLVGDAVFGYDELSLTWCQKQHPDNVSLDLSELGIRNLPKNFISSQHVTCLDLQNNEFENRIEFNIFKKQPNLEYLNLAKTNIHLQYLLYYASHPKLKILVLDRAYNYRFRSENRKVLHLDFPNLEKLSLQQLYPHDNYNPYLSYFDFSTTKLTHLFLSNNKIGEINEQFFERFPATLTHLFVETCSLTSYSASMNKTKSLISLSMDDNKFSCSNGGCLDFENHPELKYLSLANCEIISLSHNSFLSNLKLVYLDLSGNQIQQLSERTFLKTPVLESLNLNDNQLWKIPNLHSLINLKKLYVKNNQITNLDQDSFSSLENLQILSLSTNNINSIDSNTFDNLLSLIVLDLSGNQISNLEYRSTFNLQYLILTNNIISSMDNIQLGNNTTLEYLVLVNNPLMSITPKMLQFLPDDTTIVLKEKSTVS